MTILAIDPGNKESAYVLMDEDYNPIAFEKTDNEDFMFVLEQGLYMGRIDKVVIEMVASYGLPVGKDVFETCVFIGRLVQICSHIQDTPCEFVYRKDVKMNICHQMTKVNDATIRHALINRFAEHDFKTGKGTKKNPDFFYGFSADVWSAYAVGVTYLDKSISPKD